MALSRAVRDAFGGEALTLWRTALLVAVDWAVLNSDPTALHAHLAWVLALLSVASLAYVASIVARLSWRPRWLNARFQPANLGVFLVASAGLAGLIPFGIAYLVVAGMSVGAAVVPRLSGRWCVLAGVAAAVSTLASGAGWSELGLVALAGTGAVLGGFSRRAVAERADQAERLLAEQESNRAEHARGAALAERNRIAREIHDVLAHSLSALSVQLEAADAVLAGGDLAAGQEAVRAARSLAVSGLVETRRAVHALRDEPRALSERLGELAGQEASLRVQGTPRPLGAEADQALYRAAQEALTNARRHAPGACLELVLEYRAGAVVLTVVDELAAAAVSVPGPGPGTAPGGAAPAAVAPAAAAAGAASGAAGGYGLVGMRERVALLGGSVEAAPTPSGFRVRVAVPA